MRGSRAELAVVLSVLGSYVSKWSVACDRVLTRVMAYLFTHPDVGLEFVGDSRDLDYLESVTFEDSDHGGHKADSRSVSGAASMILGRHLTRALIAWFAIKQTVTAVSTGDAEIAAASVALRRLALPISGILEDAIGIPNQVTIVVKLKGDAQVAEHVFAAGRS